VNGIPLSSIDVPVGASTLTIEFYHRIHIAEWASEPEILVIEPTLRDVFTKVRDVTLFDQTGDLRVILVIACESGSCNLWMSISTENAFVFVAIQFCDEALRCHEVLV